MAEEINSAIKGNPDLASKIIRWRDSASSERAPWETEWQEIADFILQRKNSITIQQSKGNTRTVRIYDTTAPQALEDYVMSLWSFLFQGRWIKLEAADKGVRNIDNVKRFWDDVSDTILLHLGQSNFNLESVEALYDHGGFGTTCMNVERGKNTLYTFKTFPINGFYIIEDEEGFPATIIFEFEFTSTQAVGRFGLEALHPEIQKDYTLQRNTSSTGSSKTDFKKFKFIEAVFPRDTFDSSKLDKLNKPIAVVIVDEANKVVVEEGGKDEMSLVAPRFQKSNTEVNGRSVGKRIMPTIKMVNRMERTSLKAHEKEVDPPILMPHDTATSYPINTDPGGRVYWDARNAANKPEVFKLNTRLIDTEKKIEKKQDEIRQAYFKDMFDALGDRRDMTATEVLERIKKQARAFIPIFGRIVHEWLNPQVEAMIGIAFREGVLPPVPEEVAAFPEFNVVYNNKLTSLIKLIENESVSLTLDTLAPYFDAAPQMIDNFDMDEIARGTGTNFNMHAKYMVPIQVRDERRKARAEAEQQAAQLAATKEVADIASTVT